MSNIIESLKSRRSIYSIGKEKVVDDAVIENAVRDAVKYTPSAFGSGTQTAVLLLNEKSDRIWDITMEALRKIVPAENFSATEEKINSFKAGYGTVLYFTNENITKNLQESYPLYAHNFPIWAQQENGMLQLAVWSSLSEYGLGASLQHYSELIEEEVKKEFNIPSEYKMLAQMPFGKKMADAAQKQDADLSNRFIVIK